ncbi:50S ribosomal protein L35 [Candidatus Scalindua japonica]|uniref:Large ribosomal subunit protein bL35 n=1 Tax=Candidatus Scalindua japonica TaxID=1284222 RepID=A0A286U2Q3_9BACT|nr:50S ribosomal protein L35 [Candidatus Scalindua japonica]GAX62406.1 50S ribosomal protein L35 [Candidatus Scalindua japonica]
MPKLKTHKGLTKRVKVSPNGKIKRRKAFAGHLMSGKTGNRKRALKRTSLVSKGFIRPLMRALGKA